VIPVSLVQRKVFIDDPFSENFRDKRKDIETQYAGTRQVYPAWRTKSRGLVD